jgi:hypothetical protein
MVKCPMVVASESWQNDDKPLARNGAPTFNLLGYCISGYLYLIVG